MPSSPPTASSIHTRALAIILVVGIGVAWATHRPPRAVYFPIDTVPVLLPLEGFHEEERLDGWPAPFRWTEGDARLSLPNPGGMLTVRLVLGGGTNHTVRTLPLTLTAAGSTTYAFPLTPDLRTYHLLLPPQEHARFSITLESPTVQEPHGRTLGIMVSRVAVSGGGNVPLEVVVMLIIGSVSGYLLLQQARFPPWHSVGIIVALQVVTMLWHHGGGWQYALLTPLVAVGSVASIAAIAIERWLLPRLVP